MYILSIIKHNTEHQNCKITLNMICCNRWFECGLSFAALYSDLHIWCSTCSILLSYAFGSLAEISKKNQLSLDNISWGEVAWCFMNTLILSIIEHNTDHQNRKITLNMICCNRWFECGLSFAALCSDLNIWCSTCSILLSYAFCSLALINKNKSTVIRWHLLRRSSIMFHEYSHIWELKSSQNHFSYGFS